MSWRAEDIPNLTGRVAVVTGANSGLGFEAARALARKGATVVLACRDFARGREAAAIIVAESPGAVVDLMRLDLASLASIRAFAVDLAGRQARIDILLCSAGVMATPRRTTEDGFELQFGTNHLGHFALTGLLLPLVLAAPASRIVSVASVAEKFGTIHFDDLMGERRYGRWEAYCQSKLANVLFIYELQRRLTRAGARTIAAVAHPGFAATGLRNELRAKEPSWLQRNLAHLAEAVSQSAEMGVLPQLYAATAPDIVGGAYYGPDGFLERAGHPKRTGSSPASRDETAARRLWEVSETFTGVSYDAQGLRP